jgi:hypothetical protein
LTSASDRPDNGHVRLRWLALLFCLLAWATPAQIGPGSSDAFISAPADSSDTEAGGPSHPGETESRWNAGYRANVPVASLWKSSAVHAHLAAAPSGAVVIAAHIVDRSDRPARYRSPHLLHVPLLI